MAKYRTFRNSDPPHLFRLWTECGLGRGAAQTQFVTLFDETCFRYSYFDPAGVIVAEEQGKPVGFAHAGFGFLPDQSGLNRSHGVICAVMVHPQFRRQGIGRELVRQAEQYLQTAGATQLQAGPARGSDPFYFGLYGGSRLSGFLESDPLAQPFFTNLGYLPSERHVIHQRSLRSGNEPTTVRLQKIRRLTELEILENHERPTFWTNSLFGWYDLLRFRLLLKDRKRPVAAVTAFGLDNYIRSWNARAIGLLDMWVDESYRGKGYGQTLLVECLRRLRQQNVDLAEIHAPANGTYALRALRGAGFTPIDSGIVYQKGQASPPVAVTTP